MSLLRTILTELRKTATLPGAWAGMAVAVLGSVALTILNAVTVRGAVTSGQSERVADTSPFETAFAMMPLGTVGAVVIGVVAMSSEYTAARTDADGGRQITTTLTAIPGRLRLLTAKALSVIVLVTAIAIVAVPLSVVVANVIIGDAGTEIVSIDHAVRRWAGGALYWTLMGLIAFAITVLARSGIIPLIILIANSSVVSFSLLLTNLTPLAHWLPDMAGRNLFGFPEDSVVPGGLEPIPGAIVMGCWTLALLIVAGVVFRRRDA
ncbi:ABC transporter permease [Microbacterium sp. JB110]|uniref:ABC transporter permease n=1 Tax=Microbacterium sp. JB110 TaxID=2024477 RepID=UPI00097E79D0|nr:ABC transporter permease [Microbacterium sp. JB110]RCS61287.1 ABC transporter permease [Microbacterium sp. JB110]SJM51154.1 putative integral membrane protein [Frigoribacterium sp. JB110]